MESGWEIGRLEVEPGSEGGSQTRGDDGPNELEPVGMQRGEP